MIRNNAECRKTDLIKGESPEWLAETFYIDSVCHAKDIRTNTIIIVGMDEMYNPQEKQLCSIYIGERR